jgi:hypothetical protein
MPESFIYNGQVYREGDRVTCELDCCDSGSYHKTPDGWIIINDAKISSIVKHEQYTQFFICQNDCVGCNCRLKLRYKYSWSVSLEELIREEGSDTRNLKKVDADCMVDIVSLAYPIKVE